MSMEVILLERVESLGQMGAVVRVRPGYARNYLLPQKKALRATKDNLAYFETQRAALEKRNAETKKDAEKVAQKLEGLKVTLIRLASEGGQLFGSVNARDIADAITAQSKIDLGRSQISVNQSIKNLGLFEVPVALHPELTVKVTVNIARSEEEAKTQAKTGKALIANEARDAQDNSAAAKAAMLEDSALAAEQAEEAASEEAAAKPKKAKKAKAADAETEE